MAKCPLSYQKYWQHNYCHKNQITHYTLDAINRYVTLIIIEKVYLSYASADESHNNNTTHPDG